LTHKILLSNLNLSRERHWSCTSEGWIGHLWSYV